MKKNNKDNKEKLKVRQKEIEKLNDKTKTLLKIVFCFVVFKLVTIILMHYIKSFAIFYITKIINPINGVFFYLFSLIPYFSYVILIFFIVLLVIGVVRILIISNNKKEKTKILNKKYNNVLYIFFLIMFVFILYFMTNMQLTHLPIMDDIQFIETKNKTYNEDDLTKLLMYYEDNIKYYSNIMKRDDNGKIIYNGNYTKQASENLKKTSDKLPLLKGLYPLKSYNFNNIMSYMYGSSIIGLTHFYSTYFNYENDPTEVLNTVTHEFCHSKGYTKENETVMCSYVAGINSNDDFSKYSAYLEAFGRSLYAYSFINEKESEDIEDRVLSKCLLEGYHEICDTYMKHTKEYELGANNIYIYTYKLLNYANYKDELINALRILSNNGYELKLYSDKSNVTIEQISNLIDKKNNDSIYIEGKIDKDKFEKIKDALKNDRLYLEVYQENKEYEESDEMYDNPQKYFLSPFPEKYDNIYNSVYYTSVDYSYERATRMFLEYHDKYGY